MRITVDGRLVLPEPTGIGRVISCVLQGLAEIDCKNYYSVFCRPGSLSCLADHPRFSRVETRVGQFSPGVFFELPRSLRKERPDLVHFNYFVHPPIRRIPYVVTIFDTVYSHFPQALSRKERLVYRLLMYLSIHGAKMVITDSNSAKSDIVRFFRASESNVCVIPLGVESRFRPYAESEISLFRSRYSLPEHFLLYIGNHKPHKNVPALIDAFKRICSSVPHFLLFLDSSDTYCTRTKNEVQAKGLSDRTIFLKGLPDYYLPMLYCSADLFVFPSLCEGFGLPPLEAMACGTPVVTSNRSSLPEVVGNAGIMVDPCNTDALADAMLRVLRDPDLRNEMLEKGLERASQFTWEKTARQTLAVYEDVAARATRD